VHISSAGYPMIYEVLFGRVSEHQAWNLMTIHNLAIVFGQLLFGQMALITSEGTADVANQIWVSG
jgi:RhoGAP domain